MQTNKTNKQHYFYEMCNTIFSAYEVTCWLGFSITLLWPRRFVLPAKSSHVSVCVCARACVCLLETISFVNSAAFSVSVCPFVYPSVTQSKYLEFLLFPRWRCADAYGTQRRSQQSHPGNEIVGTHHQTTFWTTKLKSDLSGLILWAACYAMEV